jgi:hypothetical protein
MKQFAPDSESGGQFLQTKITLPATIDVAFYHNDHAFIFQRDVELGRPQKRALTSFLTFSANGIFNRLIPPASRLYLLESLRLEFSARR